MISFLVWCMVLYLLTPSEQTYQQWFNKVLDRLKIFYNKLINFIIK